MNKNQRQNLVNKELVTITKGAVFSFIGKIFGKGATFLVTVLLTRALGPALFGVYALGETIISLSSRIGTLGMDQGALKYIAAFRGQKNNEKVKGTIVHTITGVAIISSILGFAVWLFSNQIALFFHEPRLADSLKIFAIATPLLSMLSVAAKSTLGFKAAKLEIIGKVIVRMLMQAILVTIFYFLGYKLIGMTWAFVLSICAGLVVLFINLQRLLPSLRSKSIKIKPVTKKLFTGSLPLMYVGILGFLISWTDILMLGHFTTSAKVGIYKVAVAISGLVVIFLGAFVSLFQAVASEYYYNNKLKHLNQIFQTTTRWVLYCSLPLFLILMTSPRLLLKIFGNSFQEGTSALFILSVANLINVLTFGAGAVLAMTVYQNINAIISTIGIIINVVLNYLLIGILQLDILGAAIATGTTIIIINILRILFAYIKLKLFPLSKQTLKVLLAGAMSLGLMFFLRPYLPEKMHYFIVLVVNSSLVSSFFIMSLLIGVGFNREDKMIFNKFLGKIKQKNK